jgi:CubicO group peptidase (beta-lactamase class C family)
VTAQILVSRGGKVAFSDVYGYADVEAKQPLKADAIFRWASMTKPVTCVAAMICYERGLFHLDDELSKYLPEWETTAVLAGGDADAPQLEAPATPITIKMLLTHTSGITSLGLVQSEAARMMSRLMKQRVEEHGQAPSDLKEHCEFLASAPLVAQPGTLWHYGAGLTVLGRLCEVWSGQSFDVFLQQNLFEPLGMVDAGFRIPMTKLHRLCVRSSQFSTAVSCLHFLTDRSLPVGALPPVHSVQAYRYAGPQKMELVPSPTDGGQWTARGGVYDGSGGLAGTVADYFHFAQMLANKGVGSNGTRIL